MCTSSIKDLRAWTCPQQVAQRDEMLAAWADLLREQDEVTPCSAPQAKVRRPAVAPTAAPPEVSESPA